jgi:hypothetical protein
MAGLVSYSIEASVPVLLHLPPWCKPTLSPILSSHCPPGFVIMTNLPMDSDNYPLMVERTDDDAAKLLSKTNYVGTVATFLLSSTSVNLEFGLHSEGLYALVIFAQRVNTLKASKK